MKKRILLILLTISLLMNIFFLGKWLLFDRLFHPSKEYQHITAKEKVIAIDTGVHKIRKYPFYYEVHVRTNQEIYIFTCQDETCSDVKNESWSNSIYQHEEPRLPLKK